MTERAALFCFTALQLVFLTGCGNSAASSGGRRVEAVAPVSEALQKLRKEAYGAVLKQDFEIAIQKYEQARQLALTEHNQHLATQFLINIAGCYQTISAYREAMQQYRIVIDEARRNGLVALEAVAVSNVASLLLEMGELQSAGDLIKTFPLDGSKILPEVRLAAFIQQFNIFARLNDRRQAGEAFQRALKAADEPLSEATIAASRSQYEKWPESIHELRRAWAFAAYAQALTRMGDAEMAEEYSYEAFRLRSIYGDKARLRDALQLAILSRNRGDFETAERLLQIARRIDPTDRLPMHQFLLDGEQARIELARGRFGDALPYLRRALVQARRWRMEVLPADSTYLRFESSLAQDVQVRFLEAILQPGFDLSQEELALESLWIAEEARFASMRAAQFPSAEFSKRLPSAYWNQLTKYRQLQLKAQTGAEAVVREAEEVERSLHLLEAEAGLDLPASKIRSLPEARQWQRAIAGDQVVFSYYLAEPNSLAWVTTRDRTTVRRIAGRNRIAKLVKDFRQEVMSASQFGKGSTGLELSQQLFGEFLNSTRTTPFWTVVVDQELSTLPIAALPVNGNKESFLIRDRNVRIVPSAIFVSGGTESDWEKRMEGIGDAVYNAADQRATPLQSARLDWTGMNRLASSARELKESIGALRLDGWQTRQTLSVEATSKALTDALVRSPDIIHLSAHFVPLSNQSEKLGIVLSPEREMAGNPMFTALDLNPVRTKTKLVVLSGCSSSAGEVVPSIGINGLARGFLISGADTVVATLWPTLDTSGPIFPEFYRELTKQKWSSRSAAESLRKAQLTMIGRGGWAANPAYWAAYIAISKG